MDELRTDLEELLGDGDLVMSTVDVIAARLAELGYMKVVRCLECKHYGDCGKWLPILEENLWFCSAGERVVAESATGEEGE